MKLATDGQFIVQGRLDWHPANDTASSFVAVRPGVRVVFGSAHVNGFIELEHNSRPRAGGTATTGWSGGIEFRASDELWLSTGFGRGYAPADDSRLVMLANVRWRVSNRAALSPN